MMQVQMLFIRLNKDASILANRTHDHSLNLYAKGTQ